ncbi:hypothetical protein F4780DRAFT_793602 [Xylariomycetidae sp. FL0641]|nr:hypothetical protein F4780DRAFT_793602 [Xylariomycetidae sp. FL0641]
MDQWWGPWVPGEQQLWSAWQTLAATISNYTSIIAVPAAQYELWTRHEEDRIRFWARTALGGPRYTEDLEFVRMPNNAGAVYLGFQSDFENMGWRVSDDPASKKNLRVLGPVAAPQIPGLPAVVGLPTPSAVQPTGSASEASGKKERKRKTRDPDAPPIPMNRFIVFKKMNHDKVRQANPGMDFGDISKEVGRMWRALPKDGETYLECVRIAEEQKTIHEQKYGPQKSKKRRISEDNDDPNIGNSNPMTVDKACRTISQDTHTTDVTTGGTLVPQRKTQTGVAGAVGIGVMGFGPHTQGLVYAVGSIPNAFLGPAIPYDHSNAPFMH